MAYKYNSSIDAQGNVMCRVLIVAILGPGGCSSEVMLDFRVLESRLGSDVSIRPASSLNSGLSFLN